MYMHIYIHIHIHIYKGWGGSKRSKTERSVLANRKRVQSRTGMGSMCTLKKKHCTKQRPFPGGGRAFCNYLIGSYATAIRLMIPQTILGQAMP